MTIAIVLVPSSCDSSTSTVYLSEKVADFRIYRAQLKRILLNNLYFLQIKAGRKLLHKIGVTKRPIEERVTEVQRDESGSL